MPWFLSLNMIMKYEHSNKLAKFLNFNYKKHNFFKYCIKHLIVGWLVTYLHTHRYVIVKTVRWINKYYCYRSRNLEWISFKIDE